MRLTIRGYARLAMLACAVASGSRAQEPANPERPPAETRPTAAAGDQRRRNPIALDSSAIRGNQELPKVMYIVPWKDPAMVELAGRPVNSLVEEVMAPVDREVFRRQARYFSQLYGVGQEQSVAPEPAGPRLTGTTNQ